MRAIGVLGIALVALIGGGGCSSSDGGSGSSHSYDDKNDDNGSTSGSTGGSEGNAADSSADAARDVRIERCAYDKTDGYILRVAASNSGEEVYTYSLMVEFTDPSGKTLAVAPAGIFKVSPGATKSGDFTFADQIGNSPSDVRCDITTAVRKPPMTL
ncbi:hypothetical protein ACFXOY_29810 [Streptomyces niveus]|uniref:hypothetical protein n=1 Tax=Streptomyces niveus TaxID=193462 RepID=UPI0036B4CBEB